jgi:hypothetical protein
VLAVVDIDDTLLDSAPVFVSALNAATGLSYGVEHLWTYDLARLYNLSVSEVHEVFVSASCLEQTAWLPTKAAWSDFSKQFVDSGHQLVYCTQRGWHPHGAEITVAALDGCAGLVHSIPFDVSKLDWLESNGYRPDVFVDDNFAYVTGASKRFNSYALLSSRTWNFMNTWGLRTDSTASIVNHITALTNE